MVSKCFPQLDGLPDELVVQICKDIIAKSSAPIDVIRLPSWCEPWTRPVYANRWGQLNPPLSSKQGLLGLAGTSRKFRDICLFTFRMYKDLTLQGPWVRSNRLPMALAFFQNHRELASMVRSCLINEVHIGDWGVGVDQSDANVMSAFQGDSLSWPFLTPEEIGPFLTPGQIGQMLRFLVTRFTQLDTLIIQHNRRTPYDNLRQTLLAPNQILPSFDVYLPLAYLGNAREKWQNIRRMFVEGYNYGHLGQSPTEVKKRMQPEMSIGEKFPHLESLMLRNVDYMTQDDFSSIGDHCKNLHTLAWSKGQSDLFTINPDHHPVILRSLLQLDHTLQTLSITLPISIFYEDDSQVDGVTNVLPHLVRLRRLELMIDYHTNEPQPGVALDSLFPVNLECLRIFYIPLWRTEFQHMANQQMRNPIALRRYPRLKEVFVKRSCWRHGGMAQPLELTETEILSMTASLLDFGVRFTTVDAPLWNPLREDTWWGHDP